MSTITDRSGNTTSVSTDVGGRTTLVTSPDGAMTTLTTADERGNIIRSESVYDGGSSTSTISYNDDDLPTSFTDAVGGTWSFTYDGDQNLTSITDANGVTENYRYDSQGRVTSRTDRLGGTSIFSYDSAGNLTSMTDGAGRTESFGYDGVGAQISRTDGSGGSWSRGVDGAGRTTSVTDPNGNATSMILDSNGRLVGRSWPDGGTESFTYDAEGNLTLVSETAGAESRAFAYDSGGRITSFSDITGTTSMGWDPMGRLTSVTSAAGTVGYGYNAAGERVNMSQPEGTTSYSFNGNSHLVGLTDWRGDTASFSPDADGRMQSATLANGVSSAYGYDAAGRMISIGHTGPAGLIDSFNYTLDNNGNRTAVTSSEGTESYTLDSLNRITAAAYPDGTTETFNYDAAGNRVSHTQTDGATVNYSHDAAGQLVSDSTGVNHTYDGAGNLTSTSAGDTYGYNAWGNLTVATLDGVTTTAAFDATGTRVQVDGIDQLWDRTGYGTLMSTGAGENYVHGPSGVLRDDDSWLLRDAVGSVRAVTDTTGDVTASSAFTAFGEPRTTGTSLFGYAGEQTDPNTLIHLRARGYNPAQGTFTSYDPVQPGGPSTAGWNHYTYSANNPTTWSDPTGEAVVPSYGKAVLVAVGVATAIGALYFALYPGEAADLSEAIADAVANSASSGGASSGTRTDGEHTLTQLEIDALFDEIIAQEFPNDTEWPDEESDQDGRRIPRPWRTDDRREEDCGDAAAEVSGLLPAIAHSARPNRSRNVAAAVWCVNQTEFGNDLAVSAGYGQPGHSEAQILDRFRSSHDPAMEGDFYIHSNLTPCAKDTTLDPQRNNCAQDIRRFDREYPLLNVRCTYTFQYPDTDRAYRDSFGKPPTVLPAPTVCP